MVRQILLCLLVIAGAIRFAWADSLYCSGQNGGAGNGLFDSGGTNGAASLQETTTLRHKEILKMARSIREDATITQSAHNLVLLANGDLYGFGWNADGAAGGGNATNLVSLPQKLNFGIDVAEIETGWWTSYILAKNGSLYSWGRNSDGQLGHALSVTPLGNITYFPTLVDTSNLPASSSWTRVSCRFYHCLGLSSGGKLYSWGRNTDSQLGTGDALPVNIPTEVYTGTGSGLEGKSILDFSAGWKHSAAITTDGKLVTWGYSALGALCHGLASPSALTDPIPTLRTAGVLSSHSPTRIKAGGDFTIMFFDDVKDFAGCGDNSHHVLGVGGSALDSPNFSGGTRDVGWSFTGDFDIAFQSVVVQGTDGIRMRAYHWGGNFNCAWGWNLAASIATDIFDAGYYAYGGRYSWPNLPTPQSGEDWAGMVAGRCGHCRWRQTIPTITPPSTLPFINASIGTTITINLNTLQGDGSARIGRPKIVMENGAECSNLVKGVGTIYSCTLTKVPTQPGAARIRAVLPSGVSSDFIQIGNWTGGVPLNIQPTYVASVADIPTTLLISGGGLNRTALNATVSSVDLVGLGSCIAPNLTATGDGILCNFTTKPSSLGPITATIIYSDGVFLGPFVVANFQLPLPAPVDTVGGGGQGSAPQQDTPQASGAAAPVDGGVTLSPENPSNNANTGGGSNIGGIVGGIIGAIVGIALIVLIVVLVLKRRKSNNNNGGGGGAEKGTTTTEQVEMQKSDPAPTPTAVASTEPDQSVAKKRPPRSKKQAKNDSAQQVPESTSYTTLEDVATTPAPGVAATETAAATATAGAPKTRKRTASKKKPRRQATVTALANRDWRIKYEDLKLEKELGSGAFGVVWRGTWSSSKVAIKQSILGAASSKAIEEMNREAELMCNLRPHANVLQIYGVCQHEKSVMLVSEFCSKGSLDSYFGKGVLTIAQKISIIKGVAAGITHLHNNHIVHRDLAARNVLLSSSMQPKVSDFGMSRLLGEKEESKNTASTVGPVRWMAPESLGQLQYSYASDVWSFGNTCWEIITEKVPFDGMPMLDVAVQVRDKGLTPSPWPEDTPQALIEMCNTLCWRKNPDQRASMKNVVEFLNEKFAEDDSQDDSDEAAE